MSKEYESEAMLEEKLIKHYKQVVEVMSLLTY